MFRLLCSQFSFKIYKYQVSIKYSVLLLRNEFVIGWRSLGPSSHLSAFSGSLYALSHWRSTMIHSQLRFTGCRRRSLGDHIVQDIEGLGVSTEHQGAAHHVQAVDRQRLSRDQAANGPIRGEIYRYRPIRGGITCASPPGA